jgi:cytoskeleton protein RodZ
VFEIGNSLREARVRQALEFPEIEQATKIRGKYLRALEDENFEQLPGQTYVKGFLRTYADYLGLEGQLYVDEYNSRYVTGGEEDAPIRYRGGSVMPRSTRLMSSAVLIALTAIGLATALVIAAWKFGAADDRGALPGIGQERSAPQTKQNKKKQHPVAQSSNFRVVVRAARGDSWLEVHKSSPVGPIEWQGTLLKGQSQIFTRRHLWMTIDRPTNLVIKLNGRRAQLPQSSDPVDVSVTPQGVKPVT